MENHPPEPGQPHGCQIQTVPRLSAGKAELEGLGLRSRLKLLVKRNFSSKAKRKVKKTADRLVASLTKLSPKRPISKEASQMVAENEPGQKAKTQMSSQFSRGQMVRIRSKDDIQATLNLWGELKGCAFMDEMHPYCGTTHQVIRVVERFVDERDYQVKKARGLYLLDGVLCEGTKTYGRCDRACFFFWREEWLEAVGDNGPAASGQDGSEGANANTR
jgi:hypothetical protein